MRQGRLSEDEIRDQIQLHGSAEIVDGGGAGWADAATAGIGHDDVKL